ncbi:hypothetical protein ACNSOL_06940 [Aliarcobacter lanthieri]|uniref:hypothetical protein n=1 Tax=Aliarcobacter lanthieri TaxID=1355374 RepID=UPI003AAE0E12
MDDKNKMRISDYVLNGMIYVFIFNLLFISYFWVGVVYLFIKKENYKTLIFVLVLSGIIVIVFGYWFKYMAGYRNPFVVEFYERLRKKQELNEKLIFHEKALVWVDNGYLVKTCNIVGFLLVLIGAIIYIVKYIL